MSPVAGMGLGTGFERSGGDEDEPAGAFDNLLIEQGLAADDFLIEQGNANDAIMLTQP